MTPRILVGGTIAIDHIITPDQTANGLLGGSAAFASVAARLFCPHIDVLSVIGTDFPENYRSSLENHGINLQAVTVREGASFTWTGEYSQDRNKRKTIAANDEVMTGWQVHTPEEWRKHPVVIAATMVPARQIEIIEQCEEGAIILSDSMDKWILRQPELLNKVISHSFICTMNEDEAKIYASTASIVEAGEFLLKKGAKFAIIKQGEYGSILFSKNHENVTEIFRCPAYPLRRLIDPTGAGDTFIGAIGGYLSTLPGEKPGFTQVKQAVIHATIAASFTCESFSADALFAMTRETFNERLTSFLKIISCD